MTIVEFVQLAFGILVLACWCTCIELLFEKD